MKKFIIENVQRLCTRIPSYMGPCVCNGEWNFDQELENPYRIEWSSKNESHEIILSSDKTLRYEIIKFEMLPNGVQTKQSIFRSRCTLTRKEHLDLSNKLVDLLDQYFNHISESYRIE
jgi:hypothetical protein